MSNVLIGVGGSGQHVVHAHLRMMALIQCDPREVPHVYIIDADATLAGLKRGEPNLCYEISRLHQQLVGALSPEHRAHFALIKPYFQMDAESQPGRVETALDLGRCPAYLTDIFLTDDPDASERHAEANDRSVDLLQGMMANAKIGATSFAYKIHRTRDDNTLRSINFGYLDDVSQTRCSLLNDVRRARVAIVGSSFGGTGSGVIPALVRHLASMSSDAPVATRAFMTLPWFDIESGGASAAAAQSNGIDPKMRNAAVGLRTYLGELDTGIPNANYVISQCLGVNARRPDRGNTHQGEDPHVFNLALASSIEQFLWDKADSGAVAGDPAKRKLFGMIASRVEETKGQFDSEHSAHLRFRVGTDEYLQLADIVKEAEVAALALEKGAEFLYPGKNQFCVGGDKHPEPEALRELCKSIATSYDKRPLKKAFSIFRKETAPDEVYERLAVALIDSAETLRQSLVWLDEHRAVDAEGQGYILPELDHLFDKELGEGGRYSKARPVGEQSLVSRWDAYGLRIVSKQTKNAELGRSTPRIAQAFALFMNCFADKSSFLAELSELVANQPGSPIYRVVAGMLARHVRVAVKSARSQRQVFTASQDSAPPQRMESAFIKKPVADTKPESARLCVIDKSKLDAPSGDVNRPDYQSPIQETHPLSLRQIDPYLGVSPNGSEEIAAVRRMVDEGRPFPETALKGIPNILAPKLLQRWRLLRRSYSTPSGGPLQSTAGRIVLRSTEHGLYLHACRIIEAAFWLLFSDDPRVELKEYPEVDDMPRSPFAELINEELKAVSKVRAENLLPRKAIALRATSQQPGKVVFVNDPECAWYLAANSEARRFFARIFPELPTVRFGHSELDRAWQSNTARAATAPEKGSYDARMIAGFHIWLAKIAETYRNRDLLWALALSDICASLKEIVVDSDLAPPTTARVADIDVLTDTSGQLGVLDIRRPVALSALKDIFVDEPIYFFVGDDRRNEDQWAGLWPIKGAAWEHLVSPEPGEELHNPMTLRHVRDTSLDPIERSMWEVQSIRVKLKELGAYVFRHPFRTGRQKGIPGSSELMDNLDWAAAVWPKFKAPDWRYYVAGGFWQGAPKLEDFDLGGAAFVLSDWCLVFYGDIFDKSGTQKFGEIGRIEKRMPTKLLGVPRAVELVINNRILGSTPIRLTDLPPNSQSRSCDLALDFGTSNTCMAIQQQQDKKPTHLALLAGEPLPSLGLSSNESLQDLTLLIGPAKPPSSPVWNAELQFRKPKSPLFVFQSFDIQDSHHMPRSVPSELISLRPRDDAEIVVFLDKSTARFEAELAIDKSLTKHPAEIKEAIVTPHYTPFPPNPGGMDETRDLAQFLGSGFHQDFKWPPPSGEEDNIGFRAVYIEQILLAGCATLRCAGIRKISRLVATYPGAFPPDYRDRYIADIRKIVQHVFDTTGITFRETGDKQVEPRSETIAALASTSPGDESIKVTIDMGGGTTDIGIIVPKPNSLQQPLFSYMSSIRYAGNDLLKAVASSPTFLSSLGTMLGTGEDASARLKIVIRNSKQSFNHPVGKAVALAFFEGLFEYIFTMIAAVAGEDDFPADEFIDVYLFGNGFKLSQVFLEQGAFAIFKDVKEQAVKEGLITQKIADMIRPVENTGDPKLDLVAGALKLTAEDDPMKQSRADKLLKRVEDFGHNRVPIWYPCVRKGSKTGERPVLGTREERNRMFNDPAFVQSLSIDNNMEILKTSFPITSQYWLDHQTDVIFNNATGAAHMSLGQYYLEGSRTSASSYAEVVLSQLAAKAHVRSDYTPY